jgi:hypothetical protein
MEIEEILSEFLGIDETAINRWSDDSLTIYGNDDVEYILLEAESDEYMKCLGKHKGYYIYQN